jgi:hypothetical protein
MARVKTRLALKRSHVCFRQNLLIWFVLRQSLRLIYSDSIVAMLPLLYGKPLQWIDSPAAFQGRSRCQRRRIEGHLLHPVP